MDVGSGGGSPAIPLKLALPHLNLTMVEVKVGKSAFLREAIAAARADRNGVETARVEELLARPQLHEAFDVFTMRAVRIEARMLNTLQAFLKPGGHVLLFRGPHGPAAPMVVSRRSSGSKPIRFVDTLQSRLTFLRSGPSACRVFHVEQWLWSLDRFFVGTLSSLAPSRVV